MSKFINSGFPKGFGKGETIKSIDAKYGYVQLLRVTGLDLENRIVYATGETGQGVAYSLADYNFEAVPKPTKENKKKAKGKDK